MSLTIPNDPSLALGSIVDQKVLDNLQQIKSSQGEIDAAHDKMNSLISLRRSFEMTIQELISMKIEPPTELSQQILEINALLSKAAIDYATTKIKNEERISQLKLKFKHTSSQIVSPIDYTQTKVTPFPLSAESLKMDSQYFSFDENTNTLEVQEAIKQYISNATSSTAGQTAAKEIGDQAAYQIDKQRAHHKISGTLIITATCTHKKVAILEPLVLDIDKTIIVWNNTFKSEQDKININDRANLERIANEEGTNKEKSLNIISGALYGSCFIGMIHTLQDSSVTSQVSTNINAVDEDLLKNLFTRARYVAAETGNIEIDESTLTMINKEILPKKEISSHLNIFTVGAIPSIRSSEVKGGVENILGDSLSLQNTTIGKNKEQEDLSTPYSESILSKQTALLNSVANSRMNTVMYTLSKIDAKRNKSFDIGTIMDAFENYVTKITQGEKDDITGCPISYYIRPITKTEIAKLAIDKYFPPNGKEHPDIK